MQPVNQALPLLPLGWPPGSWWHFIQGNLAEVRCETEKQTQFAGLVSGTFSLGLKLGFKKNLEGSEGC